MSAPTDAQLREILALDTIAVVGCSTTPGTDAYDVPAYLVERGYDVVPVTTASDAVFGRRTVPELAAVDRPIDIVYVFDDDIAAIVDPALDRDDVVVCWIHDRQFGEPAVQRAREADATVVVGRCLRTEHRRLRA